MDSDRSKVKRHPDSQGDSRKESFEDYDNGAVGKLIRIVPKKRKAKELPVPSPAGKKPRTEAKKTKPKKGTVAGSTAEISKIKAMLASAVRDLEIERNRSSALAEQLKQVRDGNCSSKDSVDSMATGSAAGQNFYAGAGPSSTRRGEQLSVLEGTRFVSSINQLSVSSVNIPECKAPEGEELQRHSFEMWKDMLQDSMSLAGVQDEKIMYTVFKLKAGPKLLEIYRNTKSDQGAPDADELPYSALQRYVHHHNTLIPHSRLLVTPFELMTGWKFRGTFPSLWNGSNNELDRADLRERDAESKLISKKHADTARGAKDSYVTVGDKVLILQQKRNKVDPNFSSEPFTVVSRDGSKLVVISKNGVQYTRSVNDVKKLFEEPTISDVPRETDDYGGDVGNEGQGCIQNNSSETQAEGGKTVTRALRPKESIRRPAKFDDKFVYHVFC